jgi:L-ascorbate peroxidase
LFLCTYSFLIGRVDADGPERCSPEGNLPDAEPGATGEFGSDTGTASTKDTTAAGHLRKVFYRMGLNDEEIVALSGAHTFGRAYKDRSGLGAESTKFTDGNKKQFRSDGKEATYKPGGSSWTQNWLVFDNSYFRTIPFKHADPELLKLSSDKAVFNDKGFRKFALKFRKSQEEFFASYAKAHKKLSELGSKFDPPNGIVLPRKQKMDAVVRQGGKEVGRKEVTVLVDENNNVVERPPVDEL